MMITFWYFLMIALLWSAFYRSAVTDKRTKFSVRLGLTGLAAGALVGMAAPLYGWQPDYVVTVIVIAFVYMQIAFARFWSKRVPEQYIKPEHREQRRKSDFETRKYRGMA